MSEDYITELTKQIEALDIQQEAEIEALKKKHKKAKKKLYKQLQSPPQHIERPPSLAKFEESRVLSHSKLPLHRGDKVIIRTTTTIGCKGDIAYVLSVSAPRINIRIPRLRDTTWRIPNNLRHFT